MAQIIGLPKLSPTMEGGVLVRWVKKEGDRISPDDLIAEVETDNANMDFNIEDEGVLLKLLVKEGDTVRLGAPVAIIGRAGEDIGALVAIAKQEQPLVAKATQLLYAITGCEHDIGGVARTQEGDRIPPGGPIAEIDVGVAILEQCIEEGDILLKQLVKEGDTIKVGTPIALIGKTDTEVGALTAEAEQASVGALAPMEERLLAAITAREHDSRSVYADWLEERGEHGRAEYLRLQDRLLEIAPHDPELASARVRLAEIVSDLDICWRIALARPVIEGCVSSARTMCPKDWGALARTRFATVRHCEACARPVYLYATEQ